MNDGKDTEQTNEIMKKLVGKTPAPHRYCGPKAKELQTYHRLPIVDFEFTSVSIKESPKYKQNWST